MATWTARMRSPFSGTALVTGASAGIGAIYADRLAKHGYDPILVARHEQRQEALSARLKSETGRSVKVLRTDLNNEADLVRVEAVLRDDMASCPGTAAPFDAHALRLA